MALLARAAQKYKPYGNTRNLIIRFAVNIQCIVMSRILWSITQPKQCIVPLSQKNNSTTNYCLAAKNTQLFMDNFTHSVDGTFSSGGK
jgi:hypothetical protein